MQRNLKRLIQAVLLTAVLVLAGATGCRTHDRTIGQRMDDRQVARSVNRQLGKETVYKFPDVNVQSYDGVVQLSGFVTTEQQKQRAAQVAAQVPGVRQVVNALTLKPQDNLQPVGSPTGQQYYGTTNPPPASNTMP
jgi:hyperosmotically inducible protein